MRKRLPLVGNGKARPVRRRVFFLLAGLLWLAGAALGRAASFAVTLDRDTVALGEYVTMTMTFEGGSPDSLPAVPNVAHLRISDGGGDFTQTSYVNGQVSTTRSHTFAVTPDTIGQYSIPAMVVEMGGKVMRSAPLKLTVVKSAPPPAAPKTVFLKLIVSKTEVYVGEILPVDLQLYFQNIRGLEMPHVKEEGFTMGRMAQPTQARTIYNNQQYIVATFKTFVAPARVGKIDLGPATLVANVPRPGSRQTIFGDILDWEPVSISSEPQTITVHPLPTVNVPPGFNGAVGNFSLNMTVNPTNVAVGDPITIKMQLSGRGALDSITLPAQKNWDQFELYPPTSDFQAGDDLGMSGTKTFELTVVPKSMDVKELPAFNFSYFDPGQKAYRTLNQPAVPLIVRPSAASLPPPTLANQTSVVETPTAQDIVSIKVRLGALARIQPPLAKQSWFLVLQFAPVAGWLALLVNRRQKEKLVNNPRLRRQREVAKIMRDGSRELTAAAQANDAETFFSTLFRLLQEQLGERLDLPASAITEAVVEERLRPLGLPDAQLTAVRELFQACNQARYARQSTNAELISLASRAESVLTELKGINA